MLEILAVYWLCKNLGVKLRAKNRNPLGLQILLVVLWIVGEIFGAIVATVITMIANNGADKGFNIMAYVGAIAGAAIGAGFVFLIAHLLSSKQPFNQTNAFPVQPPRTMEPANPYSNTMR